MALGWPNCSRVIFDSSGCRPSPCSTNITYGKPEPSLELSQSSRFVCSTDNKHHNRWGISIHRSWLSYFGAWHIVSERSSDANACQSSEKETGQNERVPPHRGRSECCLSIRTVYERGRQPNGAFPKLLDAFGTTHHRAWVVWRERMC